MAVGVGDAYETCGRNHRMSSRSCRHRRHSRCCRKSCCQSHLQTWGSCGQCGPSRRTEERDISHRLQYLLRFACIPCSTRWTGHRQQDLHPACSRGRCVRAGRTCSRTCCPWWAQCSHGLTESVDEAKNKVHIQQLTDVSLAFHRC